MQLQNSDHVWESSTLEELLTDLGIDLSGLDAKVDKTTTVNGHALSANIDITKTDVGLSLVNNTADADKEVSTPQAAAIAQAVTDLKDGVAAPGNTLQKLYNLVLGAAQEITVANVAARNAYNIPSLPCNVLVTDDGDGNWALYKATTTGVGASFIKISDPDLLNALMSAAAIKSAYESNGDTNAFTNALKALLEAQSGVNTGDETVDTMAAKDHAATVKSALVDGDEVVGMNSANSFSRIRTTWASIKAFLKTYFDTQYLPVTAPNIAAATGTSLAVTGAITSSGGGIGYAAGAGGVVTQNANKSQGVTLDKLSGAITMNNAALAAAAEVSFTLTNNQIGANDVVVVCIKSGATTNTYTVMVDQVAAGSCRICVGNYSTTSRAEAIVISFAVIKAVIS